MTLRVSVRGGTNAGSKPPLKEKPPTWWSHQCWASGWDGESRTERGYLAACPDCGTRREMREL